MSNNAEQGSAGGSSWGRWLGRRLSGELGPLVVLVAVFLFFTIMDRVSGSGGSFTSTRNLQVLLTQVSTVAVAALGMTLIIIGGGIDLSVGTALSLSATVLAYGLREGWPVPAAIGAGVATGALCGLINGALISLLRIVPFIVTLGTMMAYVGVGKLIAEETTVRPDPTQVPAWLAGLTSTRAEALVLGLPAGVWFALLLAGLWAAVLRYTVFGRHVFALGSNEATARLCGIHVPTLKIMVYTIAGVFVGIAGVYQFSRLSTGDPMSGIGLELRVIAAVVIGGGSLSGGQGTVLGTLTGAAIMAVIASGGTALGLSNPVQDIILGAIIVTAVTFDQLRHRRWVD